MDAMTDGMTGEAALAVGLETIGRKDIAEVGGKNASLGEMIGALASSGIMVPGGFATTADAYWQFVEANGLRDVMIAELADLDGGKIALADAGRAIRDAFIRTATGRRKRAPPSSPPIANSAPSSGLPTRPLPSGRAPPPKISPTPVSPASRKPSSISAARRRCWNLAAAATPRSSPTAPSPIAAPRASII